jgi:hypothetical protein
MTWGKKIKKENTLFRESEALKTNSMAFIS